MLGETSFQNRGGADEVLHQPATSQTEVAAYISSLTSELQGMAHRSGMVVLSYLLLMAALHAQEIISGSEAVKQKRP